MEQNCYFILVTNNNLPYLKQELPVFLRFTGPNRRLVIVDNGSTDGTVPFVKLDPRIYLIENKANIGLVKGFNIGIKFALNNRATHIILAVPGVRFSEAFVTNTFSEKYDIHAPVVALHTGGQISYALGGQLSKWLKKPIYTFRPTKPPMSFNVRPQFLSICCLILTRKAVEKNGLFNEQFVQSFADVDYGLRAQTLGLRMSVDPSLVVDMTINLMSERMKRLVGLYRVDFSSFVKRAPIKIPLLLRVYRVLSRFRRMKNPLWYS